MLHGLPDSFRAESPHYHALLKHAASPEANQGATVLTFTGMGRPALRSAAQQFAAGARKTLLDIDLAGVVSKYIGETEKNLDQLFQRAQSSNAVLLVDEADALFGPRTNVKDAHNRYGNLSAEMLLQRIARYRGTVIVLQPEHRHRPHHSGHIKHVAVHFPP